MLRRDGKGQGWSVITDFEGTGRSGGDTLLPKDCGAGASITHESGSVFVLHAADGTPGHRASSGATRLPHRAWRAATR